jgi:hypothetical protein
MLLNELQRQQKVAAAQAQQLRDVQRQLALMRAVFAKLQIEGELVAQRQVD